MDGSGRKANFSRKTQFGVDPQHNGAYLDERHPGYREYSNPTIEALLAAGYVVCGAQNYADAQYGNERCLQACIDFYRHMIDSYYVDADHCYMLGCSNGFMTTLNASARLGTGVIRGLIGLYPLCNLRHAFEETHTGGVKQAYGIESMQDYMEKAKAYDPFLDDRPDIPPTILFWSSADQALPMREHAVKFSEYWRARGGVVETVRVDRDGEDCPHGDWRHFRPDAIVKWCDAHR